MMHIGITGGIGSGKSYVCRRLEAMGYPVYDCDAEAKRLLTENTELVKAVKCLIGKDAYQGDVLNKAVVAQFLFSSSDHTVQMNSLVHPVVRRDFVTWAARQTSPVVFVETALLFQAQFDSVCDRVWCVTAPISVRLKRVMERDGCTKKDVLNRQRQQLDDLEVQQRSDEIIFNDGKHDIDKQIQLLISKLSSHLC
ncbi:MAG: dephospho-CoA kinase [Bacteroidales bacterium]|nr:dephospho-CoA kinase [Bacteroidales bacterium]